MMFFAVGRRRRTRDAAPMLLRSALAATVLLSVLFGVGVESAFAQRLGKVQKQPSAKQSVGNLPRTAGDIVALPPVEVISPRDGSG